MNKIGKVMIMAIALLGATSAQAVDCGKVTVSVVQNKDIKHWTATAKDENGKVCGTATSGNRNQARILARMDCGCN